MARSTAAPAGANAELLAWLQREHVEYEVHEHELSFTARETAQAEGVAAGSFAKVVAVRTSDGRRVLLVLQGDDHLDLHKARGILDAREVHLLTEAELMELAPTCDVGALPAVGELFGLPTYADVALRERSEISFNAGSHRTSVRVDRAAWSRAAAVVYGNLAEDVDIRPIWERT
jgi:Ala-tRNA(Pro) deacylase